MSIACQLNRLVHAMQVRALPDPLQYIPRPADVLPFHLGASHALGSGMYEVDWL